MCKQQQVQHYLLQESFPEVDKEIIQEPYIDLHSLHCQSVPLTGLHTDKPTGSQQSLQTQLLISTLVRLGAQCRILAPIPCAVGARALKQSWNIPTLPRWATRTCTELLKQFSKVYTLGYLVMNYVSYGSH